MHFVQKPKKNKCVVHTAKENNNNAYEWRDDDEANEKKLR